MQTINKEDLIARAQVELILLWKEVYNITIPMEMFDFVKPLIHSAKSGKYSSDNWLQADGKTMSKKLCHGSMCRHLAEWYCGHLVDKDNGLHPLLMEAVRSLMVYTRDVRGLRHPDDEPPAALSHYDDAQRWAKFTVPTQVKKSDYDWGF